MNARDMSNNIRIITDRITSQSNSFRINVVLKQTALSKAYLGNVVFMPTLKSYIYYN